MSNSQALQTTEENGAVPAQTINVSQQIDKHEKALLKGDLSRLDSQERKAFYQSVCESIGLNPLTKPLEYIRLNGDLTLYANKTAAAQLRQNLGISITQLDKETVGDLFVVTAYAETPRGRVDTDEGGVDISRSSGEALANARMKAITKAKRRVTLSICGLGFLDATEVDDIPDGAKQAVNVDETTGEMRPRKPDSWYDEAIEWLVGLGEPWDSVFEHADRIPGKDHPLKDWPDERFEEAKRKVQANAIEDTSSQNREDDDAEDATETSRRWASPEEAINQHFDMALQYADVEPHKYDEISDKQLSRLYAIAGEEDWKESHVDRMVKDLIGYESKSHLPAGDAYEEVIEALKSEEMRFWMGRDQDTPDMFEGQAEDAVEDASTAPNDEAFEDPGESDDLPF